MEVQYRVRVRGGALFLVLIVQATAEEVHRVKCKPRLNAGYVGAMYCCKAPLWGRRLDLESLNLTPRFAHRLLLLLWLVVVKKGSQGVP